MVVGREELVIRKQDEEHRSVVKDLELNYLGFEESPLWRGWIGGSQSLVVSFCLVLLFLTQIRSNTCHVVLLTHSALPYLLSIQHSAPLSLPAPVIPMKPGTYLPVLALVR